VGKVKADRKNYGEDYAPGRNDDFWEVGGEPFFGEEESKKVKLIKEKPDKLEGDKNNKGKHQAAAQNQLEDSLRALDEQEKKNHELQILLKTMEANMHQLEGERRQYLGKIEENGRNIAALQDKLSQYEEDLKNLTSQLKTRTQETIMLNKDNKELQRDNNHLRESVSLLEEKVHTLEKEITLSEPSRRDMEKKFNSALESLRNEVRAKHQNILSLSREVADLQKVSQNLRHANENLELELDMLNTTNVSLQKKLDKVTSQRDLMERKLQNKLVRLALSLSAVFGWKAKGPTADFKA
jgi:chromosome segregation ATPase